MLRVHRFVWVLGLYCCSCVCDSGHEGCVWIGLGFGRCVGSGLSRGLQGQGRTQESPYFGSFFLGLRRFRVS